MGVRYAAATFLAVVGVGLAGCANKPLAGQAAVQTAQTELLMHPVQVRAILHANGYTDVTEEDIAANRKMGVSTLAQLGIPLDGPELASTLSSMVKER